MKTMKDKYYYNYCVFWSKRDQEFVGTCVEFPSMSWVAADQMEVFTGIVDAIGGILEEMDETGKVPPEPLSAKK